MSIEAVIESPAKPIEVSNEKQEILDLITMAKAGNDDAYNELYERYQDLLHGRYIKRFISSSIDFVEHDDINSIMNLIFVESVNSYDPTRSKFITYLTRQIHFRFIGHYLKERMIPFSNNASKEKIVDKLNKTRCILTDNIGAMLNDFSLSKQNIITNPSIVKIELNGQDVEIPISVLFTSLIPSIVEKYENKQSADIFLFYLGLMLDNEKSLMKAIRKEFNCSLTSVKKSIQEVSEFISKQIKIKYINTGV